MEFFEGDILVKTHISGADQLNQQKLDQLFSDFQQVLSPSLRFSSLKLEQHQNDCVKEFKLNLVSDEQKDTQPYSKYWQHTNYYYKHPDGFFFLYRCLDVKDFKSRDKKMIQEFVEMKLMKNQECLVIIYFEGQELLQEASQKFQQKYTAQNKIFNKVKSLLPQEIQNRIFKLIDFKQSQWNQNFEEHFELLLKAIQGMVISNIDRKLEFFSSQSLYYEIKAKNSVVDFCQFLLLLLGKILLLMRIRLLRPAFEELQQLGEIILDKGKLGIEFLIPLRSKLEDPSREVLDLFAFQDDEIVDTILAFRSETSEFILRQLVFKTIQQAFSIIPSKKPEGTLIDQMKFYLSQALLMRKLICENEDKELEYFWMHKYFMQVVEHVQQRPGFNLENSQIKGFYFSLLEEAMKSLEQLQEASDLGILPNQTIWKEHLKIPNEDEQDLNLYIQFQTHNITEQASKLGKRQRLVFFLNRKRPLPYKQLVNDIKALDKTELFSDIKSYLYLKAFRNPSSVEFSEKGKWLVKSLVWAKGKQRRKEIVSSLEEIKEEQKFNDEIIQVQKVDFEKLQKVCKKEDEVIQLKEISEGTFQICLTEEQRLKLKVLDSDLNQNQKTKNNVKEVQIEEEKSQ